VLGNQPGRLLPRGMRNMMPVIRKAGRVTRYSSDHKEKTHEAIVSAAAACIRHNGLQGLGVARIMADAGLTHGGFYAHFASRDALLAAAVTRLFEVAVETVEHFETKYGARGLEHYVDFYLSPRHRDDATIGCPIPSLAGEARRAAREVKAAFDAGLERLADRLGGLMPKGGKRAALGLLGEMAGVLSVARTIADQRQSNELLSSAKKAVLS
jgi:TetR/AcrR family transcriptional regulator, transcriptional repressor for nem operon